MTLKECAIIEAYTGICMCAGDDRVVFYAYVDSLFGRPVYTHEHAILHDEIKRRAHGDFINLCQEASRMAKETKEADHE